MTATLYSARPLPAAAALAFALAAGPAWAADESPANGSASLEVLNQRINEQIRRLADLRRSLEREEAGLQEMRRTVGERLLEAQRGGTGNVNNGTPVSVGAASTGGGINVSMTVPAGAQAPLGTPPDAAPAGGAITASLTVPPSTPAPIGAPPNAAPAASSDADDDRRPPAVAPIFEEAGVLTAKGSYVLEPSLQYSYSSNNRVTLLGYTIIPAVLVGLVDVREVKRNTTVATLSGRVGVTNRLELEARVPYVYRSDATRSREIGTGTAVDSVIDANGNDIGDIELAARYQLTNGGSSMPYLIGALRLKSRTGTDPFEVVSDCVTRCTGNTSGTGQPLKLPTGSGFYSLQPALTWLYPADPAVLFGTFSYLHNFKRNNVNRRVLNGERESIGSVDAGDVLGFNVGLGIALNDRSSFSLGYDHASVAKSKQNGQTIPGSLRTQLGTVLLGYSYRLSSRTALNFSVGAGLTPDTPGVTLALRTPFTF